MGIDSRHGSSHRVIDEIEMVADDKLPAIRVDMDRRTMALKGSFSVPVSKVSG